MPPVFDRHTAGRFVTRLVRSFLLVSSVALPLLPALSAPSFRADKNYPEIGLRMRVLGSSVPEPLPTHKTYSYTFTRGDESFKQDRFDAHELWYATQNAGQWRDSAGNVLIIGRATRLLPRLETEIRHVLREAFDAATEAAFENIDMPKFQKAFADYWRRGRNSVRSFDISTIDE